ncbi:MAG: diaminopimelate dehydrogenase [Desulfovibrionaceae bacterium]|nr:diaminopimelate dehydrogenase [Desulfovibrionaceae bacterium]
MAFTAAVLGLGNIGRCVIRSLEQAPDFTCVGVVRRATSIGTTTYDLRGVPDFPSFDDLLNNVERPDVVIMGLPSRLSPHAAAELLSRGFNTVDSFDIHDRIVEVVGTLENKAEKGRAVAVTAAGWDPGTDSIMRTMFEAMAPVGTTFTNFGRGRSMGHSAACRSLPGIADATAITIPLGGGRHSRHVFVVLEKGCTQEQAYETIKADPYFAHDPLNVTVVRDSKELEMVADASHGVLMERVGASGAANNQHLTMEMRIDNPALTAQILVASARAAVRLCQMEKYGCYTLIDIPPIMLLPGDRMELLGRLV